MPTELSPGLWLLLAILAIAFVSGPLAHAISIAARTELDAMTYAYFKKKQFTLQAAAAVVSSFREYRASLDDEYVEHSHRLHPDAEAPGT